ncbi:hypothetical protein J7426_12440 [Tropicibacter sp. R16_0]|uniref:hypothetical protein n=1 Tax=Tropicibacter sp. R16_0 TaxID=2821102 RepID=UPI001ADC0E02|nr:hypothetical protein [Tropicibacter sp. R16_0]MBO9451074.1 hypothetical protein [Tropicibacter sp. R16_0]
MPEAALDRAINRGKIRRSLVLVSPTENEMKYFNTLDLIEFSLFRDLLLSKRLFAAPEIALETARACCEIAYVKLQLSERRMLDKQQLVNAFARAMEASHWKMPVDMFSKRNQDRKSKYTECLLGFTLRNWQPVSESVTRLLGEPSQSRRVANARRSKPSGAGNYVE